MDKYLIITEEGDMQIRRGGEAPDLEELQSIVQGNIDIINHDRWKIWVNEEGAINGMKPNPVASAFCRTNQTLYGPVLIRYSP